MKWDGGGVVVWTNFPYFIVQMFKKSTYHYNKIQTRHFFPWIRSVESKSRNSREEEAT